MKIPQGQNLLSYFKASKLKGICGQESLDPKTKAP
jgi:hypothetical protein